MEGADPLIKAIETLLGQGVLGILCVILSLAYWKKQQQYDELQNEFRKSQAELHEKRLDDVKGVITDNTVATNNQTEAFENLTELLKYGQQGPHQLLGPRRPHS